MATTTINLSSLDGSNGFRLDGTTGNHSGYSVSNAGDVNGDGFGDLIIGAPRADPNGASSGTNYVVFGKASGFEATMDLSSMDGSSGFRIDGIAVGNSVGYSVSDAGDVNNDGFGDLIVGALGSTSYIVFGKNSGFDANLDLSNLDGSNGFQLNGVEIHDEQGFSVSNAGDVNGDGFDDLIIGSYNHNYSYNSNKGTSTSYVIFGKASGFEAMMDLSSLNGNNGFRLDGELVYNPSGHFVSNAGDVNGDGFDDLIIGAPDPLAVIPEQHYSRSGECYIVFGKSSGFSAILDLPALNGNEGFSLDGQIGSDHFARSVSNAGDINGDSFADVIIGAPLTSGPNGNYSGSSYVVFGKDSGFDATFDLSSLDGNNGFRLDGVDGYDRLGFSVSDAGDINGDGFDDLIVGAPGTSSNGEWSGSSYVIFGKSSGFDAILNLSSLDETEGLLLDGVEENDSSGSSVSSAGDVNGDGFDDLMVGARFADNNGDRSGSTYIIFGRRDFTEDNVIEGTPEDDILNGTPGVDIFEALDGNDTMIGRGGADVFHGSAGNDHIEVTDLSFSLVDGGTGSDVLHLDGSNLNLDLSILGDKISGIEAISVYGRGDNTLTLTAEDLVNVSDTTNTLKVHGNAGDRVILDNEWVDQGSYGFYHTYTQDDAVLLVGQNMATEFV